MPDEQRAIADYFHQETAQIDALVAKQEEFIGLLQERLNAMTDAEFQQPEGKRTATSGRPCPPRTVATTRIRRRDRLSRWHRYPPDKPPSRWVHEGLLEAGYQGVLPGDIVFHALDGFAGAVGISDSAGQCSPVYHVCRPRYDDDVEYLALPIRYLGTSGFLPRKLRVRGSGVWTSRNWGTFARVPLTVPPVEHQSVHHPALPVNSPSQRPHRQDRGAHRA